MNNDFARSIEKWYAENRRELPWRETRDAYRIWISEIILQQTRVAQGYDYYLRFVNRFPDVQSLAQADEDEVLLMWQGLGYYSRARNLHKAARMVCEQSGGDGCFPTTYDEIKRLPGVGDYTAAAIASFAFGEARAVLDGNVYRVLSRYLGIDTPIDSTQGKKVFRALADEMLDRQQPALYNQAIMDFGAMVCTPHTDCRQCVLCEGCEALRTKRVGELPVKGRTLQIQTQHLIYIYVRAEGHILLRRRGTDGIWKGLYEPLAEMPEWTADGVKPTLLKKQVKHQLTHRTLLTDFYYLECARMTDIPLEWLTLRGYVWVREEERDSYAVSRLVQELYKNVSLLP